jgi:hypothetical protein
MTRERKRASNIKHRDERRKRRGLPPANRPEPSNCECCGKPPTAKGMCLEHCHVSGMFRGWVCQPCNTMLGMAGDCIEGLMKGVRFLERAAA